MRVVANYSTSLFDYINSDKNLKEVLSQGADESLLSEGAKKTLREKGISLNGSTTKDASVYETVQETAESVRDSVIAFTGSDAESLFTTAESSGSTAKIVTEVKSFVENYNAFASAVKEMGGSENTTYLEQMNELLSKDSDAYEKIGITFAEDGTLTLIGATTENPYFEVNGALLSRSVVFELKPLEKEDINNMLRQLMDDIRSGNLTGLITRPMQLQLPDYLSISVSAQNKINIYPTNAFLFGTYCCNIHISDESLCRIFQDFVQSLPGSPMVYSKEDCLKLLDQLTLPF